MINFDLNANVSKSFMDELKLDQMKNGVTESSESSKYDTTYDVNVDISRFMTGDVFAFVKGVSDHFGDNPIRVNGRTRLDEDGKPRVAKFAYVECNGRPKKLFLRSLSKAINEVEKPDVDGAMLKQGRMYVANRKNFEVDGEKSDFAKALSAFPTEGYAFDAFSELGVKVKCVERKQVLVARYDPDTNSPSTTRTQNNSVMYLEFVAEGSERKDLMEKLAKMAEEAISKQAKRLEDAAKVA